MTLASQAANRPAILRASLTNGLINATIKE